MALCAQSDRTQRSGYRPPARGEQHAGDQDLHMLEGRARAGVKTMAKAESRAARLSGTGSMSTSLARRRRLPGRVLFSPSSKRLWNAR